MSAESTVKVATWSELADRSPAYALVGNVDLVVVRYGDQVSVLYGRCQHRDALMADGTIDGDNLICGVHGWDYRYDTGVSEYNNEERLEKFAAAVDRDQDAVLVDAAEVAAFESRHPRYFKRDDYLGLYQDLHGGTRGAEKRLHPIARSRRSDQDRPPRAGVRDGRSVDVTPRLG